MYHTLEAEFEGVKYKLEVAPCKGLGEDIAVLAKNEDNEVIVMYLTKGGDVSRTFKIHNPVGIFLNHTPDVLETAIQAILKSE